MLTPRQLTRLFAKEKAKEAVALAEAEREKVRKYSGAYTPKKAEAEPKKEEKAGATTEEDDDATPLEEGRKPSSPSVTSAPKVAGPKGEKAKQSDDAVLSWATS